MYILLQREQAGAAWVRVWGRSSQGQGARHLGLHQFTSRLREAARLCHLGNRCEDQGEMFTRAHLQLVIMQPERHWSMAEHHANVRMFFKSLADC